MYSNFLITLLLLASLYTLGEAIFFGMLSDMFKQERGGKYYYLYEIWRAFDFEIHKPRWRDNTHLSSSLYALLFKNKSTN